MANYVLYTTGLQSGFGGANAQVLGVAPKIRIDFSKVNGGIGPVAVDTLDFLVAPANVRLNRMWVDIVRAAGAACTVDFGDTSLVTRYFSTARSTAVNANAAVGTRTYLSPLYSGTTPSIAAVDGTNGFDYAAGGVFRCLVNNTNALAILDVSLFFDKYP